MIEQEEMARRDFRMHVNDAKDKERTLINLLNKDLRTNNLMDEFNKSLDDPAYQNELIKKYNITVSQQEPLTDAVNA
jgi:hypothetical protein